MMQEEKVKRRKVKEKSKQRKVKVIATPAVSNDDGLPFFNDGVESESKSKTEESGNTFISGPSHRQSHRPTIKRKQHLCL